MRSHLTFLFSLLYFHLSFAAPSAPSLSIPRGSQGSAAGGNCGGSQMSPEAQQAVQKAMKYIQSCGAITNKKNFIIDDFAHLDSKSVYVMSATGQCELASKAGIGSGSLAEPPQLGNTSGSHQNPPGPHVAAMHQSDKFDPSNSRKLVGLIPGVNDQSAGRGILLHAGNQTLGCTGVEQEKLQPILDKTPEGTLIWNVASGDGGTSLKDDACSPSGGGSGGPAKSGSVSASLDFHFWKPIQYITLIFRDLPFAKAAGE